MWQFVRVMVDLEENRLNHNSKKIKLRNQPVFKNLEHVWKNLDKKLTTLQQTDHNAYSQLMMNEKIDLPIKSKAQLNEIISSIDRVVRKLSKLMKSAKESIHLPAYSFEKTELNKLKTELLALKKQVKN